MSKPSPSIFRDALQVSPELIALIGDDDLNVGGVCRLRAEDSAGTRERRRRQVQASV